MWLVSYIIAARIVFHDIMPLHMYKKNLLSYFVAEMIGQQKGR